MDDLCDPDFYLNCDMPQIAAQLPKENVLLNGSATPSNARKTLALLKSNGYRSNDIPRKSYTPVPEKFVCLFLS